MMIQQITQRLSEVTSLVKEAGRQTVLLREGRPRCLAETGKGKVAGRNRQRGHGLSREPGEKQMIYPLYPCPGWNGLKLGNINSMTLSEVWNSDNADRLRRINIGDYAKCQRCDKHNFCDMCAVYNYNENGDMFDICPRFCEMAEMLRECVMKKKYAHGILKM